MLLRTTGHSSVAFLHCHTALCQGTCLMWAHKCTKVMNDRKSSFMLPKIWPSICKMYNFRWFLKNILLIMLLQLYHFCLPLSSSALYPTSLRHSSSPLSSCPWVVRISSLASPFLTLFLTSPCAFRTYHLCFLFPVPFLPLSPSHFPAENPPSDHHFCDSVPVLVVCLVCFCFGVQLLIDVSLLSFYCS